MREWNFDGLVGPTHNYAGLSAGNVASRENQGKVSNPRAAALQGLDKMRFVHDLGVGQALLPPQPRPSLALLRSLGFGGRPQEILQAAFATEHGAWLRLASSAACMWTANAATVAPSSDTADARLHLVVANLQAMLHRNIEAEQSYRVLSAIFANEQHFCVHPPLGGGGQLSDEGAANHTRLVGASGQALHLFGWGKSVYLREHQGPSKHPARQTYEASSALARTLALEPTASILHPQHPQGIDAGAFHTDVLAVGNAHVLLVHELAFADLDGLLVKLRQAIPDLQVCIATQKELPVADAVASYPFNSQLVSLPGQDMAIIAPMAAKELPTARRYLERVQSEIDCVSAVHYMDLHQSMRNGGGPACLRLRVPMTSQEDKALGGKVKFTPELETTLRDWVQRFYRDRLAPEDLADPSLWAEQKSALLELASILELDGIYPELE